jgi:uncharacterized membrane protein
MARRDNERGAVTLAVALTLSGLMGIASFALDLGMQRVGIRDMQALSDVVALDMARHLDGRTRAVIEADPVWDTALAQSVARNDDTFGDTPEVAYALGELTDEGDFVEVAPALPPTAVKITSSSSVDYLLRTGEGATSRWAVAQSTRIGCFSVGSVLLNLETSNSALLNPLLGNLLGTSVLGYNGLATADIELLDLVAALEVGTPQEMAEMTVTAGEFFVAIGKVLAQQGDTIRLGLLESITAQVDPLQQFSLGDIFSIGQGAEDAVGAKVNLLQLVEATAFLADGDHTVTVPGLVLAVPGVTSLVTTLEVIESPRFYCGAAKTGRKAETAQVRLHVRGNLVGSVNGGLLLGLVPVSGPVDITLELATAKAELTGVEGCPTLSGFEVTTSDQTVASLKLDLTLKLLGLDALGVHIGDSESVTNGVYDLPLPASYTTAIRTGSGTLGLSNVTSGSAGVTLLGSPLIGVLLSPVLSTVVNPLITAVNSTVLPALTTQLGLRIAGADLLAEQSDSACAHPKLSG